MDEKKKAHKVMELRIDRIDPNPDQPRRYKNEEALNSLSNSIKEKGLLQPILVRPKGERFEIIAGERRWLAAGKAGFAKIPVIIREFKEPEVLEIALIENLQREDLNPIEKAEAYKRLIENYGYTQEQLAESMGKSRSAIANTLRLLDLDDQIKEDLKTGIISEGHARALLTLGQVDRGVLWQKIRKGGISVRQTELLSKKILSSQKENEKEIGEKGLGVKDKTSNRNMRFIEENLQEVLGTRVKILYGEKRGTIEIEFFGEGDLIRVLDLILKKK